MDAFDWLAMRRLEDKAGCELLGCLAGLIACGLGLIVAIAATIVLALTTFHAPSPVPPNWPVEWGYDPRTFCS